VKVTAGKPSEFRFWLSAHSVPRGTVTFDVKNEGKLLHNFKIDKHVTALLARGQSQVLVVSFPKPGRYPYLCTVTGHADAGMKGIFIVR
jgi:uncharacterized cupredoxin-like copper-binding protein